MSGLDGKRMRPVPGLVDVRVSFGARGRNLDPRSGLPRIFLAVRPRREGSRVRVARFCTTAVQRSAQNWHGQGESDCLIKTKHCDGPRGC